MKKGWIFLMALFLVNLAYAQHLEFAGIPLDGTITAFQAKLSAKGIRVNNSKSKEAPIGQRIFNGKWHGYNSEITVYYGTESKIVYKVEALIKSKEQKTIQGILDKSLTKIEQTFSYSTEHDVNDGKHLHYCYIIHPAQSSNLRIGTILVEPSYTFKVPDNAQSFSDMKLSTFTIKHTFIDEQNYNLLWPSETEPETSEIGMRMWAGDPQTFSKFMVWAVNLLQSDCYTSSMDYFLNSLDFFKYGCVPNQYSTAENYEFIVNMIKELNSCKCGRIPYSSSGPYYDVYRIIDRETKQFKFLQWNEWITAIKLDANDVRQQISTLESVKKLFANKLQSVQGEPLKPYWKEKLNYTLPAWVYKNYDPKMNITWEHVNWTVSFVSVGTDEIGYRLALVIEKNGYLPVRYFYNTKELDDYISFLRTYGR